MRRLDCASAALAGLMAASAALGAPAGTPMSRLAPALGNTIVSTHPDGRKARLWLSEGGTYSAESRAGERSGGAWTLKGDSLCLRQHRPLPIPIPYCKPIPAERVGRPWHDKAVNGDMVTNEIVRGKNTGA